MGNVFGENLKRIREQRSMSQDEFASLLGYKGRSSISKIEKGQRSVGRDKIEEISAILGVSPLEFFKDQRDPSELSSHEQEVLAAYRRQSKEVQNAIDRMLGIEKKSGESIVKVG